MTIEDDFETLWQAMGDNDAARRALDNILMELSRHRERVTDIRRALGDWVDRLDTILRHTQPTRIVGPLPAGVTIDDKEAS